MPADPASHRLLGGYRSIGRVGAVFVVVVGIALAVGALWLGHAVDQRRTLVQHRVGWVVALDSDVAIGTLQAEMATDRRLGPEVRALLDAPRSGQAYRSELAGHLRAENRVLSQELSHLWDAAGRFLIVSALFVCIAGGIAYFEQSDLLIRLRTARRRQSEAEVRDAENIQLLAQIFKAGPFGMHLFTPSGRPLRSVPNLTRRRGLRSFDFVATGVVDIRDHPVLRGLDAVDAFNRASTGETVHLPMCRLSLPVEPPRTGPDETIWFALTFSPIRSADGKIVQVLAITHDETDRQNLRGQLLRAERLAEVGTLAAGVAHEINNPLTFLAMNASVLQDLVQDDPIDHAAIADLMNDFGHGVRRIQGVTRELSDLAHTASDPMEAIALHELVDRTVHMCSAELPPEVAIDFAVPPLPTVRVSPRRMEQIVTNLIQNAARACVDGAGTITVRGGTTPDDHCWIEVTDNGVGMPSEVQSRIFEPFFTTRRGGQGTGLGLYLVRCYVEELGGHIDVQSTLGEGTSMRISVPADTDLWFSAVRADADLRLLVVSRSRPLFEEIRALLPEVETVVHATSPTEAVHRVREQSQWDRILVADQTDLSRLRTQIADPKLRQRILPLPQPPLTLTRPRLEQVLELQR